MPQSIQDAHRLKFEPRVLCVLKRVAVLPSVKDIIAFHFAFVVDNREVPKPLVYVVGQNLDFVFTRIDPVSQLLLRGNRRGRFYIRFGFVFVGVAARA